MIGKAEGKEGAISLRTQRIAEVVLLRSVHPREKRVDTGWEWAGSPLAKAFSHQKKRVVMWSQRRQHRKVTGPGLIFSKYCPSFLLGLSLILDFCLFHEEQMEKHTGTPEHGDKGQCWRCPPLRRPLCFHWPLGASVLSIIKWKYLPYSPHRANLRTDSLILIKASYKYKVT